MFSLDENLALAKKAAQKERDEIQASLEKMSKELEKINEKYDEEEFQSYLLENCESAKELFEMSSKAIQEIEDIEEIEESLNIFTYFYILKMYRLFFVEKDNRVCSECKCTIS